ELGMVDPFLAPDAFVRLALRDELERTDDSRLAGRTIRVGYLVVGSEAPQVQEVLAAPQLLDDERVRQQQEDLALGLALATLAGPAGWLVVWNAVRQFLDGATGGIVEREFAVGGRQIRVQLASLGPAPDGCVVALDDATALTRAARVLAWGEMARQVAHEIKN